ncbi:vacuolar protein-sorting-associated protein 46 [Trichomonascus vanleenenianus]|uniref:Did2p n=1 Tax=Trichomonascus vanleenenianus TaxID=2268995 RepID=UPI003ECB9395
MSGLEKSLFNLKFTSKQLNKQAIKAGKEMEKEKKKVKQAIMQGNNDIARLYSQNAIRKQTERLNLLKLASRIDAVASRVQTAVTMRQLTGNMTNVVRGMDKAMESMNTERISMVMDKFEQQFEDLDATSQYYETATSNANAVSTPQDEVDLLMQQVADEAGLELRQNLDVKAPSNATPVEEVEDNLNERLRALRN